MRLNDYKFCIEIRTLDNIFTIIDPEFRIYDLDLTNIEEYIISYNGFDVCCGSFYGVVVSVFSKDGEFLQEIEWTNRTTFKDIFEVAINYYRGLVEVTGL